MSVSSSGKPEGNFSSNPAISGDGRYVAFESGAGLPGDRAPGASRGPRRTSDHEALFAYCTAPAGGFDRVTELQLKLAGARGVARSNG